MVTVTLYDGSGYLDLTFFNQPWVAGLYKEGHEVAVSGVAQLYRGRMQLANQEVELLTRRRARPRPHRRGSPRSTAPPRASRRGRSASSSGARWSSSARSPDPLPAELVAAETLAAVRPGDPPDPLPGIAGGARTRPQERLKFDELFTLELGVAFRKHRVEAAEQGVAHVPDGPLLHRLLATLPFEPTGAQRRAMAEVARGDGAPAADEPAAPGRRRVRQDPRRAARRARRDRLRASGGDHGSHGDPCRRSISGRWPRCSGRSARCRSWSSSTVQAGGQGSLLDEQPEAEDETAGVTYALLTAAVTGKVASEDPGRCRERRRGPRRRYPRARAGRGRVRGPLARGHRRAAPVRRAPADGAERARGLHRTC